MQSSTSLEDFLVEIASQLYANACLAHDLSHDRFYLSSRLQSTLPMQYPGKKGLFFLAGKRFVMAKDDWDKFSENFVNNN